MRLLVIEDEERLARALAAGLTEEGFVVDAEKDGAEGLHRAANGDYSAIILDIMLPGMNGYEICAQLRQRKVWTPILMLTAKSGEYDEAEALDTGADDFLTKPFSYVVLVSRIHALIRRGSAPRPTILSSDDLTLDPATRECRRSGTQIDLTPREFELLETLLRSGGAIVAKQALLDRVWGQEFDGDPNVVEVYVSYLRRKIDHPFGRRSLETIRGVGYRLA